MVEPIWQDVRYAARSLRRAPGFAVAAIVTLALGIGADTAVFSVVDGVLLHPVPFHEADRLVTVYGRSAREPKTSISYLNFLDWQRSVRSLDGLALWRQDFFVLTGRGPAEQLLGLMVSADFFQTLRVQPIAGRTFANDDDRLGADRVAMLGETFWQRRFAGDPAVIGQTLTLNNELHTIIGITPRSVQLLDADATPSNDVFVPVGQYGDPTFRDRGVSIGSHAVARLRPGVTLDEARAEMDTIAVGLARDYPSENTGVGVLILPMEEDVAGDIQPVVLALSAAVAFVLLIACANVANLLLARTAGRSQEIAIRLALGGSRARLVRQLFIETMMLALGGGAAGIALAAWGTRAALRTLPDALPAISSVGVNLRVLGFAVVASIATGALVAVVPALRSTGRQLQDSLRRGRGVRPAHHRAQRTIVVAQVALTLVLVLGAGLMIRSLVHVWRVDPGFDPARVLTFFTGLTGDRASNADRVRAGLRDLSGRIEATPGVESASLIVGAPPLRGSTTLGLWRDDQPRPKDEPEALFAGVGPDYFRTMRIPLRRGRVIEHQDVAGRPRVAIVDEVFARELFANEDPIGKHIQFDGFEGGAEIVGVVGHVAHGGLDADATAPIRAQLYLPYAQLPDNLTTIFAGIIGVVVKARIESPDVVAAIRRDLNAFSPDQVAYADGWMRDLLTNSLASRRFSIAILGAFGIIALVLAVVGIYGTVSYMVGQRTHEIGLRAALGGRPAALLWLVLADGGKLAAAGIAIGIVGALASTQLLTTMLFDVSPTDVATFASASALLFGVAVAA